MKKHAYVPCPNYGSGWNHPDPHCEICNEPEDHANHRQVVRIVADCRCYYIAPELRAAGQRCSPCVARDLEARS